MTINTLVIDQHSINILDSAWIEDGWFNTFKLPKNNKGIHRIHLNQTVYLLSDKADNLSGLLVVNVGPNGIFARAPKASAAFERILRVAMHQFDRNISLPMLWKPYQQGALISVFSQTPSRKEQHRIYFNLSPEKSKNIYAFNITEGPEPFDSVSCDIEQYKQAINGFEAAAITEPLEVPNIGDYGILLSEPLGVQISGTSSLADWLNNRLNKDQLSFVRKSHDSPIRLRGVAGTGKTQAMVIKCLNDLYLDNDSGGDKTFSFITHSSALAHEVVRGMLFALDPSERWANLKAESGKPKLKIGTIYEFAQEQLGYEKKGLRPLSLDGREGKEYQQMLINDAIDRITKDPRVVSTILSKCKKFQEKLVSTDYRAVLVQEIMNEFSCVLDAENIRKGTPEAANYLTATRESWQLELNSEFEKRAILEIHDQYRATLKAENYLSMDQMIADFGRYLSTHEWNQLRDRDGFDLVFVDEYHFFTRVEAMTLHNLFKSRACKDGKWPLIMAYDLKQSTSDVALSAGVERFRNPGVGESVPVELNQVYRSTPQIAAFLGDLDASFPAMDLQGEYETYRIKSNESVGGVPELKIFDTSTKLIDEIFEQAGSVARNLQEGGKEVAILCMNETLFDTYRKAGRIQDKFVALTSREDMRELRYAKKKCIFSMPEYVAGLQFDTVFLIHVDQVDFQSEYLSVGARRRYVSRAYLGASRAKKTLVIASTLDRSGASDILRTSRTNQTLKEI